jgi:hypothetical protein
MNPIEYAQQLVRDLVNVEGGARLYTVKGSSNILRSIDSFAQLMTKEEGDISPSFLLVLQSSTKPLSSFCRRSNMAAQIKSYRTSHVKNA